MWRSVSMVAVPPVPEPIDQPVLAWPEAIVLGLAIAAIAMFTWPLARAMWPWSKPREVPDKQSKTWVVAFVAIPVLLVAAYFIDGAVDDYYDELDADRNEEIASVAQGVAADLADQTGYTLDEDGVRLLERYLSIQYPREDPVVASGPAGTATDCILSSTEESDDYIVSLSCPAPMEESS